MWVSRLRARFQGLQIQWLSSPLGAERSARLCAPRTAAAEGAKGGVPEKTSRLGFGSQQLAEAKGAAPQMEVPSSPAAGTQQALAMGQARPTGMAGWSGVGPQEPAGGCLS